MLSGCASWTVQETDGATGVGDGGNGGGDPIDNAGDQHAVTGDGRADGAPSGDESPTGDPLAGDPGAGDPHPGAATAAVRLANFDILRASADISPIAECP